MMEELIKLTRENNKMLKEIIKFINYYNSNQENENDFFRNVLANLVSNGFNNIKNRQFP